MSKEISINLNDKSITYLKNNDHILSGIIDKIGPLTYTLYDDYFEFLVFTIIGQMLSNTVGDILFEKLVEKCSGQVSAKAIEKLSVEEIMEIGVSKRKANAIKELALRFIKDKNYLNDLHNESEETVINLISEIHGIGPWTAKMFLIFALGRDDVLPVEDIAFVSAYEKAYGYHDKTRDKRNLIKRCKKWKPYSSIAARYLYKIYDAELKYSKTNKSSLKNVD